MKRSSCTQLLIPAAAALFLLYLLRQALFPFIIAFFLAYLLDPLLDRMEARKVPRTLGILLLLSGVAVFLFAVGLLVYPALQRGVLTVMEETPRYAAMAQAKLAPLMEKLGSYNDAEAKKIIQEAVRKVGSLPLDILRALYGFVASTFSSVAGMLSALFGMVVIPVASFYFMRDIDRIKERMESLIPLPYRKTTLDIVNEINRMFAAFVRGQMMVALVLSFIYSVGLYLIGVPAGIFIGILAGFSNVVPYLPLLTGFVPALILTYLHFGFDAHLVWVLLLFGTVQIFEGFFLTPKVMGKTVGLHPVTIMLAILVGGLFFGIVGVVLAVPAAASIKVLFSHAEKKYRSSALYKGEEEPPNED